MARKDALPLLSITAMDGPSPGGGRGWWRSLDELADSPEFHQYLHREFPENASEWLAGSRRDFLRLMGASLFLAGVSGCDIRQPQEKIVPTVRSTNHAPPGLPLYFTTAMDFAGSAVGLTVESRDGRPIKVEGNTIHPASLGATGVFAQAATLDLYDPDRARAPTLHGRVTSSERLRDEIASLRKRFDETKGGGLRILIETSTSPTLARLLESMTNRWPKSKWFVYESIHDDPIREGMALAYGDNATGSTPIYDFSKADVVLSIDCDFLAARDLPPSYVRQFADARRIAGKENGDRAAANMVRLYHLGSTPTPTAAKADYPLALGPAGIYRTLRDVAVRLGVDLGGDVAPPREEPVAADRRRAWIAHVARDLKSAGERAVVVVGREPSPAVHALAHTINEQLGGLGKAVRFVRSPQVRPADSPSDIKMLGVLTEHMNSGEVEALFVLGGNPVFTAPSNIDFRRALDKVDFTLTLSPAANETSDASKWLAARSHFLETWGDARAYDGTASIVQPLLAPLYQSLSEIELLAMLLDESPSGYAAVRKSWQEQFGTTDSDPHWQQALADGVIDDTAAEEVTLSLRGADELRQELEHSAAALFTATNDVDRFDIVFKPDPTIWDGQFINNGWLQELPKPLSHVVWDNPAWIAPGDAMRLQLKNGDVVIVGDAENAVEIPVWIVPGHAEATMTLFSGYGRQTVGRVGKGTGFNIQPLRTNDATTYRLGVPIRATGRTHEVVSTQHYQVMEGRHLARVGGLDAYLQNPDNPPFAHPPSPDPDVSFYKDWPYKNDNKWGMTIDLTACVGCSACVIACQAENNIPVVGKKQVGMNRHMHWIRVDTYYQGEADQPDHTLSQPVPCMQCERAPCEVVCPVAATNHSDDGLNQMIYNRCVGTRYCSNNCPYKVRRFNFLDYSHDFISEPSLHLLSNPEVTIRSRGVMEKCTYCVQRIEHARIGAQLEDSAIRDGEIKTACQAVCPAQAIRFGDLNDAKSRVRQTHDHPLNYALLEELNTKPRTTYLAEVFNRTEEKTEEKTEAKTASGGQG